MGVPKVVSESLGRGAGGFSLVMAGYAVGAVAAGAWLARRPVRREALGSLLAWSFYLPAYLLLAFADSRGAAMAGALLAALGQGSAVILLNSAEQESVPDGVLGRVMRVVSLVLRGAHATGLLLVAPLFAVAEHDAVFAGAALALSALGLACAAWALTRRPGAGAPAPARGRTPRS